MRITIDTGPFPDDYKSHVIKVHGHYTMDELIKFLSRYYPDFTWKDVQICEELPKYNRGIWDQINKAPIQSWPGTGVPYTGNPITYTGTGITGSGTSHSAGSTLTNVGSMSTIQEYMEAAGLIDKK